MIGSWDGGGHVGLCTIKRYRVVNMHSVYAMHIISPYPIYRYLASPSPAE